MEQKYPEVKKYRPDIEGLRGFAIICVIIYHLNSNFLPGGFLGVDIFFVISGFLITSSIQNGIKNSSFKFIPFIKSFYKKRFLRIYPSLIIYFLIFFLISLFQNPNPGITIRTGLSSIFGLSNLYLASTNLEYFGHALSSNPFLITWSLSLEIQFYILFPILIFLAKKFFSTQYLKLILIFLSSLSCLIFIFNQGLYFSPFTRIWGIILGSLAFLYNQKKDYQNIFLRNIPLNFPFFGVILSTLITFKYIFINHLLVGIFSAILIANNCQNISITKHILESKPLMVIGKRSYSLFLWHWGFITFFFWLGLNVNSFMFFIYFGLTFIFSEINYQYIEKFFINKKQISCKKNLMILYITITPFILFVSLKNRHRLLEIGNYFSPEINKTFQYVDPSLSNKNKYFELLPKLYRKNYDFKGNLNINQKTIFLIGDSHVANHVPSILKATNELNETFRLVKIKASFFSNDSNARFTNYEKKVNFIMTSLSNSVDSDDLIVFATDFNDLKDRKNGKISSKAISEMNENLEKIIKISKKINANVSLVDLLPIPCLAITPNDIEFKGSKIFNSRNQILKLEEAKEIKAICDYPQEIFTKYRNVMTKIYKNLAASNLNVDYLDFSDELCPNDVCSPIGSNNKFIYIDQSPHISIGNKFILKVKWKNYLRNLLNQNLSSK